MRLIILDIYAPEEIYVINFLINAKFWVLTLEENHVSRLFVYLL